MTQPLRTLPIVERWDCQSCGLCCHGNTIILDKDDLAQLQSQNWEEHPDFRGVKTVVRETLLGGRPVLAKRPDGACVFLSKQNRCRIHELHGAEAKPAICRMFPLQLASLDRQVVLTTRRSCPSAAADQGRELAKHVSSLKRSGLVARFTSPPTEPPPVARRVVRSWREFLATAAALERLVADERFPLVRRLVHGLRFCTVLNECKLSRVQEAGWDELLQCLEELAVENCGAYFRDRQPPSRGARVVLRQLGAHYIRCYPGFTVTGSWRERMGVLWMSARFARGKGSVPRVHAGFPPTTFAALDRPLGVIPQEVLEPFNRLFESHAMSKYYAIVGRRRSLVASFRSLALLYPLGLWLLRIAIGERSPARDDVIQVVVALERGEGMSGLVRGATAMAESKQLERAIAWYGR